MKNFVAAAPNLTFLLALAVAVPFVSADDMAPDALVKTISEDVIAAIKADKDVQSGNPRKIADLVQAKILPHFDFAHTTRIAMGPNWRRATPAQQERLTREFRTLLVRTYSTALVNYRDQSIEFKPLRSQPADTHVTVRSEVKQPGTSPLFINYEMEKTLAGWKIYDVKISGASLAVTYRDSFAEEVRNHGIDGLIDQLATKNRLSGATPASVQT